MLFSVDSIIDENNSNSSEIGFYILTNPVTGKYITGKYLEISGSKITFKIDNYDDFKGIDNESFIKYVTYYNKNECKCFNATVNDFLDLSDEKFIVLDVCEYYEKK